MTMPFRWARFFWNNNGSKNDRKYLLSTRVAIKNRIVVPCLKEFKEEYEKKRKLYKTNRIQTSKYRLWSFIPRNLFEQFHRPANFYFLVIVLLNWFPAVEAFKKEITMIPLLVVFTIIAVKDGLEDYTKYKLDKKINNLITQVYCWKEKKYIEKLWKDVKVGDFIRLSCNKEIPADMVLLYSSNVDSICHIETSSLDGETDLKERHVVKGYTDQSTEVDPATYSDRIECEPPNNDLNSFQGFIEKPNKERVGLTKENLLMRGCTVRNTDVVVGIVVYAGHETKALLNNTGSRYKRSKLEWRVNRDILCCVLLLFLMCSIGAFGHAFWLSRYPEPPLWSAGEWLSPSLGGFLMFWTMLMLLQVMIPISLYVSIEFIKLGQIYFIQNDIELYDEPTNTRIHCGSLNVAEDLGQIQFVFTDKTGTLTENKLVFRRCSIAGKEYGHKEHAKRLEAYVDYETEDEDVEFPPSRSRARFSQKSSAFISRKSESHMFRNCSTMSLRRLAFNSPIETDVLPDLQLQSKFNRISSKAYKWTETLAPMPEIMNISEFFIALTICNTVVVSQPDQPHLKRRWSSIIKRLNLCPSKGVLETHSYSRPIQRNEPRQSSGETQKSKKLAKSPNLSVDVQFLASLVSQTSEVSESSLSTLPSGHEELKILSQPDADKEGLPCEPIQLSYEADSPDEAALVHAARAYGCILHGRSPDEIQVDMGHLGTLGFELLHVVPFDSTRKRMSVVVRHPILKKIVVYTKGADSIMMDLLDMEITGDTKKDLKRIKMKEKTQRHLDEYATKGLRTLCLAMKVLSDEEYNEWWQEYYLAENRMEGREQMLLECAEKLENNLTLLGATGIEDRLQEGVPETIEALQKAGINIWMLTGDKQETAVNIAYSSKLLDMTNEICILKSDYLDDFEEQMDIILEKASANVCPQEIQSLSLFEVPNLPVLNDLQQNCALVIDGPTLEFALHERVQHKFLKLTTCVRAVICCRATPLQKSRVVTLVQKELKVKTLAIGDGANDVSMIQVADIGIGISDQEDMQAVLSSDFAISQFAQLKKLLLVHGHWCYTRLANMILYFFYKNLVHVSLLFWFQFFCGFSGTPMVDYWSLIFFNVLYTSIPPINFGIFDKDLSAESLMSHPELYKITQKAEKYGGLAFALNLVDAFYQSLVCFFIPYFTYRNSDMDLYSFGIPINTAMFFIINLHLIIESKSLNKLHFAVFGLSAFLYFGITGNFGATCIHCNPPDNPYWMIQRQLADPVFYLVCIITVLVALLPRFTFRVIQNTIYLSPLMKVRLHERKNLPLEAEVSETSCTVDCSEKYTKSIVEVV